MLPGAGTLAFIDIDSMRNGSTGTAKQGARFGHTKIQGKSLLVRGLNALTATVSTPLSAPVIGGTGCAAATPRPRAARPASSRRSSAPRGQAAGRDRRSPGGLGLL